MSPEKHDDVPRLAPDIARRECIAFSAPETLADLIDVCAELIRNLSSRA